MTPPHDFVTFPFSDRPRRYVRHAPDDWNEYRWTHEGMWDWNDNCGDEHVAEIWRNGLDVFVLNKRGEQ